MRVPFLEMPFFRALETAAALPEEDTDYKAHQREHDKGPAERALESSRSSINIPDIIVEFKAHG